MIPVYGFLEGDTIGLLMFAYEHETVADLAAKLQKAASLRVLPRERVKVLFQGRVLEPQIRIAQTGLGLLDRFDVVEDRDDAVPPDGR